MKAKISKTCLLFIIGGTIYTTIETIWRYFKGTLPTHWSMFILGGVCFLFIGAINEYLPWDMPLTLQALIGTVFVLAAEFVSGCVLNLWLKLNVWDYSNMPFNLLGQICLPFALAWYVLSIVAIILDDYLRYWIFNEEEPRYKLF